MAAILEDTVELSRTIAHSYYDGDVEPYLSHLCSKSVWLGTGGRILFGKEAIQGRLQNITRVRPCQIYREDYYPLPLTPRCEAVMGELQVGEPGRERGDITVSYTFLYQLIGTETKLVLLHANYEFLQPFAMNDSGPVLEIPAYQFVRDILLDIPPKHRLAVPCGNTTLFVQPDMIFYIRSRNRKAEIYCVDKVIQSDLSISAVNAMLPETFCPIHRCYTVNSRYVMSICRYEVTMITGETLPVPFHTYNQVKAALEQQIV